MKSAAKSNRIGSGDNLPFGGKKKKIVFSFRVVCVRTACWTSFWNAFGKPALRSGATRGGEDDTKNHRISAAFIVDIQCLVKKSFGRIFTIPFSGTCGLQPDFGRNVFDKMFTEILRKTFADRILFVTLPESKKIRPISCAAIITQVKYNYDIRW